MTESTHETSEEKQVDTDLEELFSKISELIRKNPADRRIPMAIKLGKKMKFLRENIIQTLSQDSGPLGNVCRKAVDFFESEENAAAWLFAPNYALSGNNPISLLENEEGIKLVEDTLGRAEWGVFS